MGLDTSHGCWHGAYSAFMKWRCKIAEVAGLPPLNMMEGFYNWSNISSEDVSNARSQLGFKQEHMWAGDLINSLFGGGNLPIKWDCLKPSPLNELLHHSDCDGIIQHDKCEAIASELELLLPLLPDEDAGGHIGFWRDKTKQFIDGLRLAAKLKEDVDFH